MKNILAPAIAALLLVACDSGPASSIKDAQVAFDDHDFQTARIHMLNVLSENPNDSAANLLFAQLMIETGDGFAAENSLKKVRLGQLPEVEKPILLARSDILKGQYKPAIARLNKQLQKEASEDVLYWLGFAHIENESIADHIELIKDGAKDYPKSAKMEMLLARYASQHQTYFDARHHAGLALEYAPEDYDVLIFNGQVQLYQGALEEARVHYKKASDLFPNDAFSLAVTAGIDLDLGKIESAKNIMAQSNIRNSNHWFVHFQKARLAFLTGDLIKANELLDNNPPRMDSFAPAIRLAGEVAFKLGRCEYALSRAQRALGSDPNDKLASKLLQDAEQALADKDSKICS